MIFAYINFIILKLSVPEKYYSHLKYVEIA